MKTFIAIAILLMSFTLSAKDSRFSITVKLLDKSVIKPTEKKLPQYVKTLKKLKSIDEAKLNAKQKKQIEDITTILKKYKYASELKKIYIECHHLNLALETTRAKKKKKKINLELRAKSKEIIALFKTYPQIAREANMMANITKGYSAMELEENGNP